MFYYSPLKYVGEVKKKIVNNTVPSFYNSARGVLLSSKQQHQVPNITTLPGGLVG